MRSRGIIIVRLSNHERELTRRPNPLDLARDACETNLPSGSDYVHATRCSTPTMEPFMRLRSIALTGLIGIALLTGAGSILAPARADDSMNASVVNYEKIPAGATFVTDLNENTELTSNAESLLKQALAKRGLNYAANGTIGFAVGTARTVGSRPPDGVFDPSNSVLHIMINSGDIKGAPRLGHSFRVTLTAYDRASGRVLSRGFVTDQQPEADPIAITGPMIEKLLDAMEF